MQLGQEGRSSPEIVVAKSTFSFGKSNDGAERMGPSSKARYLGLALIAGAQALGPVSNDWLVVGSLYFSAFYPGVVCACLK